MNNTFKLLFHLRKPKLYIVGPQPIYLRITIDGQRAEITTQRESDPVNWNPVTGRQQGSKATVKQLNAYLDSLVAKVYECQNDLIRHGIRITAESIKSRFTGQDAKARMLVSIFEQHNSDLGKLVGKEYSPSTLTRYKTTLQHVVEIMKKKYSIDDINLTMLNHSFITDFDFYLRTERKCINNSAVKYIKNFRKVIGFCCLTDGWTGIFLFSSNKK